MSSFNPLTPVLIGVPAFVWFSFETNWKAALALFLCMLANNISTQLVREQDEERARKAPPSTP